METSSLDKAKTGLEAILDRFGLGKYHYMVFVSISLTYFSYGGVLTLATIMP
jgi:hypothetical protein